MEESHDIEKFEKQVAIHEAAHAFMAWVFRVPFEHIVLNVENDESSGWVELAKRHHEELGKSDVLKHLIVLASGIVAENICLGFPEEQSVPFDPESDFYKIKKILELFDADISDSETQKVLWGQTLSLVTMGLPCIKALAEHLLNEKLIVGQRAIQIIEDACKLPETEAHWEKMKEILKKYGLGF